ncbi:Threonylcarbamoyladenosine tRNA methylthiotransferase [Trichinella nelsoni]|uniref:Threonylcarbamoyladenosine tRNA methylthiotransferase n=1 Tax=Trichinella nelsoni TaxID=6336 RepID=A0A0V0RRH8_9BILA|nr:Threonylcarbamoyladenosine tRNA methylthiotransferase [Trichinella nelsoni]
MPCFSDEDQMEDETTFLCGLKKIPRYGTTSVPPNRAVIKVIEYKVTPQDTLPGIALKFNSSVAEIKRLNRLWSQESFFLRETLNIPLFSQSSDESTPVMSKDKQAAKQTVDQSFENGQLEDLSKISVNDFFNKIDRTIQHSAMNVRRIEEKSSIDTIERGESAEKDKKGRFGNFVSRKKSKSVNHLPDDIEDVFSDLLASRERKDVKLNNGYQKYLWPGKACADSFIPGAFSVYVKTWGCTHNSSDSEYMAGLMSSAGYGIVDDPSMADIWLLNSCTVKTPSEQHVQNELEKARALNKPVIVSGCVPQAEPSIPWLQGVSLVGIQQIDRIVEVVEETLKGNTVQLLNYKKVKGKRTAGARLDLPKVRRNPLVEIIAINTGCLNNCTYCKTKKARGNLASYSIEEIIDRAESCISEGVKEIWLTSEDLGAYGRDIDCTLPELLKALTAKLPDGVMLRLGMTNPPFHIPISVQEIGEILNHPCVYSFLHIPVQSGSDAVLRDMRREYNVDDFCAVVEFMRKKVPGITIATDVICGFPTETEQDFNDTLDLVEKYRFASLFINQFYPRPGTPAAKLKRLDTAVVKDRTRRMTQLFNSYEPYRNRVGLKYQVLITERSFRGDDYLVGHNKFYEQILVANQPNLLGQKVWVKIVSCSKHSMVGELTAQPATYFSNIWQFCPSPIKDSIVTLNNNTSAFYATCTDFKILLVIWCFLCMLAMGMKFFLK